MGPAPRLPITGFSAWRFIEGGEALGRAILSGQTAFVPTRRIGEAMNLMLRICATPEALIADTRVRLSASAILMAYVLPETAGDVEAAVVTWRGPGIGGPEHMHDPEALEARILLALRDNEVDDAVRCVDSLAGRFPTFPSVGTLYDLVVARVQGHGVEREVACLRALEFLHRGDAMARALVKVTLATPVPTHRRRTTPHAPAFNADWHADMVHAV